MRRIGAALRAREDEMGRPNRKVNIRGKRTVDTCVSMGGFVQKLPGRGFQDYCARCDYSRVVHREAEVQAGGLRLV